MQRSESSLDTAPLIRTTQADRPLPTSPWLIYLSSLCKGSPRRGSWQLPPLALTLHPHWLGICSAVSCLCSLKCFWQLICHRNYYCNLIKCYMNGWNRNAQAGLLFLTKTWLMLWKTQSESYRISDTCQVRCRWDKCHPLGGRGLSESTRFCSSTSWQRSLKLTFHKAPKAGCWEICHPTDVEFTKCVHTKSLHSCMTLCDPMDCSPPGSSVQGSLQARELEWVTILSSREWGK